MNTPKPMFVREVARIDDPQFVSGQVAGHRARRLIDAPDAAFADPFVLVDGGLNPRIFGAALKTGTKFAVEVLAARVPSDRSLSTPQAAGGGGRRPAFTGIYRRLKSTAEFSGVATSHLLVRRTFSDQADKCAEYARILTAGNSPDGRGLDASGIFPFHPRRGIGSSANRSVRNGEIPMSIEKNTQTVKDFFAAIGRGDREGLLALVAEDIVWTIPGEDWPLAGTHRGHAGVQDLLRKASEEIETSTEPHEYVAQGARVLIVGFAEGKIKATSKTFKDDWVFDITVQNGKLTKIREYVDTQALARAAAVDASGQV